jgi:oligoendopeptidase F
MNLGFDRLIKIKNVDEWKSTYNKSIKNLDQLYQEEERLYYMMYAQGKENNRLDEIQRIKHELMTDEHLKDTLSSWKETFTGDKVWHRRLDVFLSKLSQEAIDSHPELVKIQQRLQSNLMDSTFIVNGKEYNLGTVHSNIMENPNRELRKQLYLGSKKIGEENESLFRTLIQKRNKLAMNLGYANYYLFRCSIKEIDMEAYIDEMNLLLNKTEDASNYWDNRIKEKFGWKTLHCYDQYFSTFNFHQIDNSSFNSNRMKEVLNDVLSSIGIPTDQIPVSIECLEIPYGGFCININPNEIKLVVNKRDSYSVFLSAIHELGHAIDGHYGSIQYPELYRFYSSIAAEGIAELFQTIIMDKEFLMKNFDLQDEEYVQIEEVNHLLNLNMLKINHYYSLVEYELYKNPERRFQEIANECYKLVFGYEGEAYHPASEMFYIENPAFFQDYNFALAIRDMIRNEFKIKSLYENTEVFQELLEKFIKPNQLYSWQERVEHLCGEPHTFAKLEQTLMERPCEST